MIAPDVSEVVRLVRETLAEFGLTFGVGAETDDQLMTLPESYESHGGRFWVARKGEVLLGTAGVFPVEPKENLTDVNPDDTALPGRRLFELRKMYLKASARGLGVGKLLLDEAVRFSSERGATHLVLDTTERMERAIAFYESNGFVRDDTQRRGERCSRGYSRAL